MTPKHIEAAQLYAAGNSLQQVAEALVVSIGFVRSALKSTGTPARDRQCGIGKRPDHEGRTGVPMLSRRTFDYDEAARLYRAGNSLSEIAVALGVKAELVRRSLKVSGVERRARGGKSGSENHQFKGGTRQRYDGYLVERGSRRKHLEHRAIAERALGRQLAAGEVVHHINCNRQDNRPENLLICTQAYHMALHARMRRDPYWREIERTGRAASTTKQSTTEDATP